jgi:hypothetical protein
MCPQALFKIGGETYVAPGRDGKAFKKINILHDRLPSPRLRGTPFEGPSSEAACYPKL